MQIENEEGGRPRKDWIGIKILFDNAEEIAATGLLFCIGSAIFMQIVMRSLFNAPLGWPEELSQFLFVWASVLGAMGALKRCQLISIDTVVNMLPAVCRKGARVLSLVAILLMCWVLIRYGWVLAQKTSTSTVSLPFTWSWAYFAAPVFGCLIAVRLIQRDVFSYRFDFIEQPKSLPSAPSVSGELE